MVEKEVAFMKNVGLLPIPEGLIYDIKFNVASDLEKRNGFRFLSSKIFRPQPRDNRDQFNLILDIGGTNFKFEIRNFERIVASGEAEYPTKKWERDDFLSFIFNFVIQKIDSVKIKRVGIIFSFPGESTREDYGIDLIISNHKLTKEWEINFPGQQWKVGKDFLEIFKDFLLSDAKIIVTNDTVAGLMNPGNDIFMINGTGYNLGFFDSEDLGINLEAGNYQNSLISDFFYSGETSKICDLASDNPLSYLSEKMITIPYLKKQFEFFILLAILEKLLPSGIKDKRVTYKVIDSILMRNFEAVNSDWFKLTEVQYNLIFETMNLLVDRSVCLVSAFLAGAAFYFKKDICVFAEGGTICNTPMYKEKLKDQLEKISKGYKIELNLSEKRFGMKGLNYLLNVY